MFSSFLALDPAVRVQLCPVQSQSLLWESLNSVVLADPGSTVPLRASVNSVQQTRCGVMSVASSASMSSTMPECGNIRHWLRVLADENIISINDPSILLRDSVMHSAQTTTARSGSTRTSGTEPFELVEIETPERLSKNAKAKGQTQVVSSANPELPPGVRSVEEWGRTLCVMPKVKSLKMSYDDLVKSDDPDHAVYLKWVVENATGRSGKIDDLANYLKAAGWSSPCGYLIPGTKETRVYKN